LAALLGERQALPRKVAGWRVVPDHLDGDGLCAPLPFAGNRAQP
jgi:hypothetical protein